MSTIKSMHPKAKEIITTMQTAGYTCYAVGGSVRDTLMGLPTKGWDFTTNATPEQILAVFSDSFYDNLFGTVGIKIYASDKKHEETEKPIDIYEITTYRSEKGYKDHRHPDIISWGTTLEEDLSRRDFTIDAIALNGTAIVDPYHGQDDITNKIIRTVGNPEERFTEDALRMIRAIRIASQLGFQIEEKTTQAIQKHAALLMEISKERIRDEFLKILVSPYGADGIVLLKNTGLLACILPEMVPAFQTEQKSPKRHHLYDVGVHSIRAMEECPSTDPIVKFATLIHDVGKPKTFRKDDTGLITFYNHEVAGTSIARGIVERLRFSKKDSERILTLIRWHQFSVDERQTDSAIRRIIRRVGKENMNDMLALRIGDRLGGGALETSWRLELFKKRLEEVQKQPFSIKDLKVNGNDVMNILGCRPGPIVGETLNELFSKVEKGTLKNEREVLLTTITSFSSVPTNPKK
ncbi:MAG: CCA tRNA nucleotidyltransferase [Candidatus Gottesmanbacteria bacterium]